VQRHSVLPDNVGQAVYDRHYVQMSERACALLCGGRSVAEAAASLEPVYFTLLSLPGGRLGILCASRRCSLVWQTNGA
jgi:hypothetical protein